MMRDKSVRFVDVIHRTLTTKSPAQGGVFGCALEAFGNLLP